MAVAYRMLSKPHEVLQNEQDALVIWRHIGQKSGLAYSLNEMARAQATLGKNKDAMSNFQEALQIRRDIGDKRGLGDTLIDMGNLAADRGDHDGALKMYKEALQLEREIGNESLQAVCLNNIGSVYSEKSQYEDALTYLQQVLQLRQKANVPQDIVDALHNLGQALASMGEYDQAITYYMKALDMRRGINDPRGAALESYGLGAVFDYQGRFGAAVNAKQDALKAFRDLKERTFWMAEILGGYANALILAGRGDEAKASLDEALSLSRELKNDGLVAQTLGFQGNALFYQGNFKAAHSLYDQALQAATRSKEGERILLAKIDLAKVQVAEKSGRQIIPNLRSLIQQTDDSSLKYSSVECSIFMAEAMMQSHDNTHAREELEKALLRSDKLGQQALSVRAHYLLATIARDSGNSADAKDNYGPSGRLAREPAKLEQVRRQHVRVRHKPLADGKGCLLADVNAVRLVADDGVANVERIPVERLNPPLAKCRVLSGGNVAREDCVHAGKPAIAPGGGQKRVELRRIGRIARDCLVSRPVGEQHRGKRQHLVAHALQDECRRGIADMAVDDLRRNR